MREFLDGVRLSEKVGHVTKKIRLSEIVGYVTKAGRDEGFRTGKTQHHSELWRLPGSAVRAIIEIMLSVSVSGAK